MTPARIPGGGCLVHLLSLQMRWFSRPHQPFQKATGGSQRECEAVRMRVGSSVSEVMQHCYLWVGSELLPQVKEF